MGRQTARYSCGRRHAVLEGGIWQDWFRLRQCWESVCGHVSPPKSSCVDSRVLPQPAQRLVSIALQ